MVETVRLRVVFEDAGILSGSQRRQGLQRCWLHLRPDIATIADLAAQLHQSFVLHHSCPHGLIISMDDFVLPPFESTCILKDKDMIRINKYGVIFKDVVKFCASQNQQQVLQNRETSTFKNRNFAIMDPPVDSSRDEDDMVLCNGGAVHMETPPSEKMNSQCKRKRSNKLQGSDNTLAIKDSHGDSLGDEEDIGHGAMACKETTSNEMVNAKRKKKQTKKFQASDSTLANMDSQADLRGDKGHFTLPILDKETSSSEMIQLKKSKKRIVKLRGLNDTLALEDSQANSRRYEQDVGLHVSISHKEATSLEMMNSKRKRKYSKLQASDSTLTSKDSQGDYQGDEEYLGHPNGDKSQEEIPSCEITNTKRKKKHSNRHQGSNDIFAIKDSREDSQGIRDNAGVHGNKTHKKTSTNEMMNAKRKKKHSNKHCVSVNALAIANSQDVPVDEEVLNLTIGNVAPKETPSKMANVKRLKASENESKGNDDGHASKNDANGDAKKVISRSARRKKAKKIWLRKKKLLENQIPDTGSQEEPSEHSNAEQNTNLEKDNVPAITRPGHIRFESSDECSVREDELVETLQWNGITSKKKGQKWGREKSYNKWNDDTSNQFCNDKSDVKEAEVVQVSNEKSAVEEVEANKDSIAEQVEPDKDFTAEQVEPDTECKENSMAIDLKAAKQLINYESFLPLVRPPMEGDVLVYRVVELSSSWCPELSPFRIGRVSSYDSICSKIVLLPLLEYPIISEEMSEEWQESCSLYKEDGTLEIDFTYLVDVRLFKAPESEEKTPNIPIEEKRNTTPVNNQESEGCSEHTGTERQLSEGWEAINRAINEKKAQLQKQSAFDKRNTGGSTTTGPWSYKALRRNALGPTLALLRSSNGD